MMREGSSPVLVRREDYTAPSHWIRSVDLTFDLDPAKTLVINRMRVEPNLDRPGEPLRLDGEAITLTRVLVNGESVSFRNEGGQLVLDKLPGEAFDLEIRNTCAPEKNSELSGLYTSQGAFFTQCEAQGFRRITYFLDRPDVMAVFKVTLKADAKAYPVLLSNGNLVESGKLDKGRHFAVWSDPHPKPAYLFALVGGNLVCREQRIRSRSDRDHLLQVYVRAGDLDKTEHAMNSLIASVAWDEARFGLSLDLERFMIVAVSDFNMGAMENKGLNIFNTKFVLASPATATDVDFSNVEAVVGHEYFHNWTGNRITCRDWFQLSLKEGLTVYRDQEFSQDMAGEASARAVKRIEDVRQLRQFQFVEDAGPMAHPVRPDQYQAIDNFYTATVYEKGAEVVRMMATLVGRAGFRRGMDLYFQRHDGQAVTCDDFAQAIADANPDSALALRLEAFKRWYAHFLRRLLAALARQPQRLLDIAALQRLERLAPQPDRALAPRHRGQPQLAVAQALQRQLGDHAAQSFVAGKVGADLDQPVRRLCIGIAAVRRVGQHFEPRHAGTRHRQQLGRQADGHHLAQRDLHQPGADLEQLAQLLGRQAADHRAAPRQHRHQALSLQDADGLAHRPAADGKLVGQLLLADARTRRQRARDDAVAHLRRHLLGHGARRLQTVGQQPELDRALPALEDFLIRRGCGHGRCPVPPASGLPEP